MGVLWVAPLLQATDLRGRKKDAMTQFNHWFEGSKVTTDQGQPLVVYHGSPSGPITEFKLSELSNESSAFFFSADIKLSDAYASGEFTDSEIDVNPTVIQAYLSIKNPAVFDGAVEDSISITDFFKKLGLGASDVPRELQSSLGIDDYSAWMWYNTEPSVFNKLRELGYDGFIAKEQGAPVFAAFDPSQIFIITHAELERPTARSTLLETE